MKYIKTYEKINPKKYLLMQSILDDDLYFVLELTNIDDIPWVEYYYINTKKLYTYDKNSDKLTRKKHQTYAIGDNDAFEQHLIYQSDILQDVLDVIPTLKDVDKYNI